MQFDRAYYRRFYFDPATAVANRREMGARARLIAAMTEHAGLPVRRILEAGCGTGMLGARCAACCRAPTTVAWRRASTCVRATAGNTDASSSTAHARSLTW